MMINNETYKGSRYTYGFQNRPPGYAHNPPGVIYGSEREHPDFNYGTVDYPKDIGQDAKRYELTLVSMALIDEDMKEFMYHCCSYWQIESYPGLVHAGPWSGLCLLKEKEIESVNGSRKFEADCKVIYLAERANDYWWVRPFLQTLPEHVFRF